MFDIHFPLFIFVFLSAMLLTVISERKLIPFLSRKAKQPIYTDGPKWHIKKSGTPTMGGAGFVAAFVFSILIGILYLIRLNFFKEASSLISVALFALMNSLIGVIDDVTKLKRKENKGLTPLQKLGLQLVLSIGFLAYNFVFLNHTTTVYFSFGVIDFGFLYYPLSVAALLGTVNCANLTDGIDGLASSVGFSIAAVLFLISISSFLSVSIISSAMLGITLGFLFFNKHPAKIFMGDTGSLFLGALVAGCAFILKNPLLILFVGSVYLTEGVSVILQVAYYKLTKKRLFKMAPLHHHLEKNGFSETRICLIAVIVTLLSSIPAMLLYWR